MSKFIEECDTLSYDNDDPIDGEVIITKKYPWLDRQFKEKHIQQLDEYLKKNEMKQAFRHIKYLLCTAPALGLPDYKLTFHLYVAENGLVASAVLAQTHGDKLRPVAYYFKTLPLIVQGMVPSTVGNVTIPLQDVKDSSS
uniref:Reverse transcriptase/retrotransposon-derived protein RNase H-like domain-containing protein n=1 Tax=Acanthochromis polyacanthus TaxID=80966 RepID=A0A3Q1I2N3_9TELE